MVENQKWIEVKGAREHNLKNINVKIPREKLVVVTGLSGSGKSSLAMDTIYAEGQRRYLMSLSAYARSFLSDQLQKPDVDTIEGISPSIAIEQKRLSQNPRSIVATVTEIYDYFRLLFASIGIPHCHVCGKEISPKTSQEIIDEIFNTIPDKVKFKVTSPIIRGKKGTYTSLFKKLRKEGYSRVIVQDEGHEPIEYLLDESINLNKNKKHTIEVVIDRLIMKKNDEEFKSRLANSIETALNLSEGLVNIELLNGESKTFSEHFFCPDCGISYNKLLPRDFSFNTPYGACPFCHGLGSTMVFDESKIISNKNYSLYESELTQIGGFRTLNSYSWRIIEAVADHYNVDLSLPVKELPKEFVNVLLYGSGSEKIEFNLTNGFDDGEIVENGQINNKSNRSNNKKSNNGKNKYDRTIFSMRFKRPFEGIINTLQRRYQETTSEEIRQYYMSFMTEYTCSKCQGKRLKPESLAVTIRGKNIWDICEMSVKDGLNWFQNLALTEQEKKIAKEIIKEIRSRYSFLNNVGLDYLTLDRMAKTLSGGEAERIRLATQIGSNLTGVLYVLDEPTIGLHPRDKFKLINMLKELRNKGNTVLVVEHDEDVIRSADYIIDMGPGAGDTGGYVVAEGPIDKIISVEQSITAKYLSNKMQIEIPKKRRTPTNKAIVIKGARENNLKNIDVKFPLGLFICVTGVSGAGKSSLIEMVLYKAVKNYFNIKRNKSDQNNSELATILKNGENYDAIEGLENIDKVINIDQSPIGRTPKSIPATYTKVFDYIREVFAQTEEAKIRGYKKGRFSFNVKAGRCEKCRGLGYNLIEMHFLPDVYVKCDVCKGKRYNEETLEVKYKGKNIYEILKMTHNEALEFFKNQPKIRSILQTVVDVGLGYLELGQPSNTLSGGESQRMKLSRELSKRSTGKTLYILDEPTTGLHFHDVKILINVLQRLVDQGNTVIVIEHNLDVIKSADYIIDLGPEGGEKGGNIVAVGSPEDIATNKNSYTGKYLKKVLN
ncbi:MAG: excinuclease ABC subunit UvrA [Promethearchaeota archaeon]